MILGWAGNGGWPMMGFGYGLGILGLIFMIAVMFLPVIIFVYFIVWLFRDNKYRGNSRHHFKSFSGEEHMGILKRRYAKGEITKEQYEDMKKTLKNE